MRRNIILGSIVTILSTITAVLTGEGNDVVNAVSGLILGLGLSFLIFVFFKYNKRFGAFTTVALLSIITGVTFGVVSLALPQCPSPDVIGRCPTYTVGTLTVLGALTPLLIVGLILPFYFIYRLIMFIKKARSGELDESKTVNILRKLGILKAQPKAKTVKTKTVVKVEPEVKAFDKLTKSLPFVSGKSNDEASKLPDFNEEVIIKDRTKKAPTPKNPTKRSGKKSNKK